MPKNLVNKKQRDYWREVYPEGQIGNSKSGIVHNPNCPVLKRGNLSSNYGGNTHLQGEIKGSKCKFCGG